MTDNMEKMLRDAAERREKTEFNLGEFLMEQNRAFDRLFRNPPQNPQTFIDQGKDI